MAVRPIDKQTMLELIIDAKRTDPETGSFAEWLAEYLVEHMHTLTPPNEWVSVEERLPEVGQEVLVYWRNTSQKAEHFELTHYDGDHWFLLDNTERPWIVVVAWMPLPAPPAKEGRPMKAILLDEAKKWLEENCENQYTRMAVFGIMQSMPAVDYQETPNEPLTQADLDSMDYDKVWIDYEDGTGEWALVCRGYIYSIDTLEGAGFDFVDYMRGERLEPHGYKVYRRPPEGEEAGNG